MDDLEYKALQIMKQCPRFERCSAPICPLDLLQNERDSLPGDPKCTLGKARRSLIGQNTDLPYKGLTSREWKARKRWENLDPTKRAVLTQRMEGIRALKSTKLPPNPGGAIRTPLNHGKAKKPMLEDKNG